MFTPGVKSGKQELRVTQKFVELLPQIQSSNARFSLNRYCNEKRANSNGGKATVIT
jgi:hypothetical protein